MVDLQGENMVTDYEVTLETMKNKQKLILTHEKASEIVCRGDCTDNQDANNIAESLEKIIHTLHMKIKGRDLMISSLS